MNGYQRRKLIRDRRAAAIQEESRAWKKIEAENFILSFKHNWKEVTDIPASIQYKEGWYIFNGKRRSKMYLIHLLRMHQSIQHERELGE